MTSEKSGTSASITELFSASFPNVKGRQCVSRKCRHGELASELDLILVIQWSN